MSMLDRARKTAAKTDRTLSEKEANVLFDTQLNLAKLSPEITEHALYPALIAAIREASSNNRNVALLTSRVEALKEEGSALVSKVLDALR
ncbi:hypothetical protein FCV66_06875 [Enterovibrio norvegicus]|uniref:hypothetical protein n=1 Tax=Enterovibrio norvegicus TaxID=188144 RepID=UPI000C83026B|nr:hypothetical protein [Enterovibrio norvegicus]PMI28557.1 hypothetical protein BCU47_21340 [Enterovibrio norvegicus]TKF16545.1 hypothetical protein FCV66_06875 [Enterovibrio norvegicus]